MRKVGDASAGVECDLETNGISKPESITGSLPCDDALQQVYLAQVSTSVNLR